MKSKTFEKKMKENLTELGNEMTLVRKEVSNHSPQKRKSLLKNARKLMDNEKNVKNA